MFLAPCKPHNRPQRQRRIASALELLPDSATMRDRIVAVYAQATPDEHLDGAAWYRAAELIGEQCSSLVAGKPQAGAGIVAALSPQCSWDENVVRALAFSDGDDIGGLADGLGKAAKIAAGADPLSVLGGRKVRSFFHNIVGRDAHVTVDRHAVAIVCGRPLSDTEIKVLERPGAYVYIAGVYRSVARELGIPASTLQAITWVAWRRIQGIGAGLDF